MTEEKTPDSPQNNLNRDLETKQTGKKKFELYESIPYNSLKSTFCQNETDDCIFKDFKYWVSQQEGDFLCTFDPPPSKKCNTFYFHTGLSCEEKEEQYRQKENQIKIKAEIHDFLRKRLRLVQRLIYVYKRAKRGIIKEYRKDLKSDPLCEQKKKAALKQIVDMMVRQMALEYLYLKSVQIKKNIQINYCILINPSYLRHLKNMYKYTRRTAEKLRCLLEMECSKGQDNVEVHFGEGILRNMARMYLNDIENLRTSEDLHSTLQATSSEYFDEESSTSLSFEYECMSNIEELNDVRKDFETRDGGASTAADENDKEWKSLRLGSKEGTSSIHDDSLSDVDEITEEYRKPETPVYYDVMIGEDETVYHDVLHPEEETVLREIRRDILSSEDPCLIQPTDLKTANLRVTDEGEHTLKLAEIKIMEDFKREIWMIEAFYFFTTRVHPELAGKFKLEHKKSDFDEDKVKFEEDLFSVHLSDDDFEWDVNSNVSKCLRYLNDHEITEKEFESENQRNVIQLSTKDKTTLKETKVVNIDHGKKDTNMEESIQISDAFTENISLYSTDGDQTRSILDSTSFTSDQPISTVSRVRLTDSTHFSPVKRMMSGISKHDLESDGKYLNIKFSSERKSQSIPSFRGPVTDPFEMYRKCAKSREQDVKELLGESEDHLRVAIHYVDDRRSKHSNPSFADASWIANEGNSDILDQFSLEFIKTKQSYLSMDMVHDDLGLDSNSEYDMKIEETCDKKKCFPTLLEVLRYFTRCLDDENISSSTDTREEEIVGGKEIPLGWDHLNDIKWKMTDKKTRSEESVDYIGFDLNQIMTNLRKSNFRYMRGHPEMTGIIVLLLREFSAMKPEKGFIQFIRDTLYNRHFAKRLSCYLSHNNQGFRKSKEFDPQINYCRTSWTSEQKMFSFDKPTEDYWREWGVDYKEVVERRSRPDKVNYGTYNQDSKREPSASLGEDPERYEKHSECKRTHLLQDEAKLHEKQPCGYIQGLLEYKKSENKMNPKSINSYPEWGKLFKNFMKNEDQDLKNEISCTYALANETFTTPNKLLKSGFQKSENKKILYKI